LRIYRLQGGFHPLDYFFWDAHVLEHVPHPVGDFLLLETWQGAWSTVPGAMVVHVLVLLNFCGHRAIVVCAREHSPEGHIVFAVFRPVVAMKHGLSLRVQIRTDEERLSSLVRLTPQIKLPNIKRICEHFM
jgi:hypothetical protein